MLLHIGLPHIGSYIQLLHYGHLVIVRHLPAHLIMEVLLALLKRYLFHHPMDIRRIILQIVLVPDKSILGIPKMVIVSHAPPPEADQKQAHIQNRDSPRDFLGQPGPQQPNGYYNRIIHKLWTNQQRIIQGKKTCHNITIPLPAPVSAEEKKRQHTRERKGKLCQNAQGIIVVLQMEHPEQQTQKSQRRPA